MNSSISNVSSQGFIVPVVSNWEVQNFSSGNFWIKFCRLILRIGVTDNAKTSLSPTYGN